MVGSRARHEQLLVLAPSLTPQTRSSSNAALLSTALQGIPSLLATSKASEILSTLWIASTVYSASSAAASCKRWQGCRRYGCCTSEVDLRPWLGRRPASNLRQRSSCTSVGPGRRGSSQPVCGKGLWTMLDTSGVPGWTHAEVKVSNSEYRHEQFAAVCSDPRPGAGPCGHRRKRQNSS